MNATSATDGKTSEFITTLTKHAKKPLKWVLILYNMYFQTENLNLKFMNTSEKRRCLFCGEILLGRSDKKYCDDNCRNNHHYQIKHVDDDDDNRYFVKMINAPLWKNRKILMSLNTRRSAVVTSSITKCLSLGERPV